MMRQITLLSFLILPLAFFSQEKEAEKEDPKKMFRDIVNVEVDRAKYAPKPAVITPTVDPKAKKKKYVEEIPEESPLDTLPPMMPAPTDVILKRALAWYSVPSKKYVKANGSNSGKSVTCNATFIFKQKMLNPENEVDGKITMDVLIEAKEGKYRYTVKNIKHKATKQGMSGGDIFSVVPEAGSLNISDRTWRIIKTEALHNAALVVEDMKEFMKDEVPESKEDEW